MLLTILKHIRNDFRVESINGKFNIENGTISLPAKEGQYVRILGSILNDGVYKYPVSDLKDEEFEGTVLLLAIPQDFLNLVADIQAYVDTTPRNDLQAESFGGYSYSKMTTANGVKADWTDVFRQRLNAWRKI